jgi:hypothetical protein
MRGNGMNGLQLKIARNLLLTAVSFCAWLGNASTTLSQSAYKDEVRAGVEEIYVFRTTRTAQTRGTTPACAAAPFASVNEQVFDLWSIESRAADSRIVNAHRRSVGAFTACFTSPAPDHSLQMYASGKVAHIPWVGIGECIVPKSQPPVRTVAMYTCRLDLSGLPDRYSGGFVVSSTLATLLRDQPATAHVPGYISTSIVTLRLWKKPAAASGKAE